MPVTFERTRDMEAVRRILTDRQCYRRMAPDGMPEPEDFEITKPDAFLAILAREGGEPVAAFILCPLNPGSAEVHFCFRQDTWGRTLPMARAFMEWVWRETSLNLLYGPVPSYNRLALRLATRAGFQLQDTVASGRTRHGKPFDVLITTAGRLAG